MVLAHKADRPKLHPHTDTSLSTEWEVDVCNGQLHWSVCVEVEHAACHAFRLVLYVCKGDNTL